MLSRALPTVFFDFEGIKNFKLGKLVKYTTVPPEVFMQLCFKCI